MFVLSKRSKENYNTLHEDLKLLIDEGLKYSSIDFGINEGHRSPEKQFEYYKRGREKKGNDWVIVRKRKVITYVDGYLIKGKHNYEPSMAFDFYAYVPGKEDKTYDENHLIALGHMFIVLGNKLYDEGKITHRVRWGGNFNMDQEITEVDSFIDLPHIEII